MVTIGEHLTLTRDDLKTFPKETVDIILEIQKKGWRAKLSNRSHVTLLAPDGVTKLGASRNTNSAQYLSEDLRKYEKGQDMPTINTVLKSQKEKFVCPRENCAKTFNSLENLNIHIGTEHEGLIKCPDCDYLAKNPQGLGRHRQAVHGYISPNYKARKKQEAARKDLENRPTLGNPVMITEESMNTLEPPQKEHLVLDERNSWVMDLDEIREVSVENLEMILRAGGLGMEIRVWRM